MATIQKRKKRYTATVRRKGFPVQTQTFGTKQDAEHWARHIECECDRGVMEDHTAPKRVLMGELLDRYAKATVDKRNASRERHMLAMLKREFGELTLAHVTRKRVADFRDKREQEVSASTVRNNLHLLSAVFQMAIQDWGYAVQNPVRMIRMTKVKNARDRRLAPGEEKRLLDAALNPETKALIVMAVETAMRSGELMRMRWQFVDLEGRTVTLPDTKNGEVRVVPLSKRATATLAAMRREAGDPDGDDRVFRRWAEPSCFGNGWHNILTRAGIKDLRFHDLRHEAASRLTEQGLSPLEVAAITGHKSMQMLKRYSHFSPKHLVDLLDNPSRGEDAQENRPR